jgi:hypothetical protein
MKIARYWARGEAEAVHSGGAPITLSIWRWSDSSQQDAQQRANVASQDAARRMETGSVAEGGQGYGYLDNPPREEIIEEITGEDGGTIATVTRNRMGSLILNTDGLMFIDVDTESAASEPSGGVLSRLASLLSSVGRRRKKATVSSEFVVAHGRAGYAGDDRSGQTPEGPTGRIAQAAAMFPADTFRLYQTAAGYRLMLVNRTVSPTSEECIKMLSSFDSDPLYLRLCEKQQCYRARLTPKHWRCEMNPPPFRFPFSNPAEEQVYEGWVKEYEETIEAYTTCRFLQEFGPGQPHPELALLVQVHDMMCRSDVDPESVLGLA